MRTLLPALSSAVIALTFLVSLAASPLISLVLTFVLLALFFFLLKRHPKNKVFPVFLGVGLGFACALIGVLQLRALEAPAWSGLSLSDITSIRALATNDPVRSHSGSWRVQARVYQVADKSGRKADANLQATLVLPVQSDLDRLATSRSARGGVLFLEGSFFGADPSAVVPKTYTRTPVFQGRQWLKDPVLRPEDSWRRDAGVGLRQTVDGWRPEVSGFFLALAVGRQDLLDPVMAQAFYRSGCAHVVALSGMHLALVSALLMRLLEKPLGRRKAFWPSLAGSILFVWFVGSFPSLLRAAFMFALWGLVRRYRAKGSLLAVTLMSVPVGVALFPALVLTPGFSLSCSALLGILSLGTWLRQKLVSIVRPWFAEGLGTGIGAFVSTLPVLLAFGLPVQPQGILAGLLLAPLSLLYLFGGLVFSLAGWVFPYTVEGSGFVLGALYDFTLMVARPFVG